MNAYAVVRNDRTEASDVAALMSGRTLAGLPEEQTASLIDFFRRNKYPLIALRGRIESVAWAQAVEADIEECESQRHEFVLVRNAWAREGIESIAIKSGGFYPPFPYTSDNLDVLVRREHWPKAVWILEQLGYAWLNTDEERKILFRKFRGGVSVSAIHLHAWVGWDAEFHEEEIWHRARCAEDDPAVTVPSREDVILINAAHAFFENKRFSLFDLERLRRYWFHGDIDWAYIEGVAERRGWLDGLFFALATFAHIEREYFGRSSAPEHLVHRWETQLHRWPFVRSHYRRLTQRRPVELPFRVSFAFSKILYYRKLLNDQHETARRRFSSMRRTLFWGLRLSALHRARARPGAFPGARTRDLPRTH